MEQRKKANLLFQNHKLNLSSFLNLYWQPHYRGTKLPIIHVDHEIKGRFYSPVFNDPFDKRIACINFNLSLYFFLS